MPEQVLCEYCDNMITLPKLKCKVHQGLVHEHYFHCPECNHRYVSYFTDKKIHRDINRQKKRWQKYRQMQTPEAERKQLAKINMQDRLIKKDMDALMNRMTKALA